MRIDSAKGSSKFLTELNYARAEREYRPCTLSQIKYAAYNFAAANESKRPQGDM